MIEFVFLVFLLFLLCVGVLIHKTLSKCADVNYQEEQVAASFSARSHRLISEGIRIDQMNYSFEKHQAYENWASKLYEYMDDYEQEVAKNLPKHGKTIAYGGIRLAKVEALKETN